MHIEFKPQQRSVGGDNRLGCLVGLQEGFVDTKYQCLEQETVGDTFLETKCNFLYRDPMSENVSLSGFYFLFSMFENF